MADVSYQGHWLTAAVDNLPAEAVLEALGGSHGDGESLWAYGQPKRCVHESGASVHFGSAREDQPVVLNVPGEVCEGWWDEALGWVDSIGGRITRCDLAADVGPDDAARGRLVEMVDVWKRGKVETRMDVKSHHLLQSDRPGDGWTAYFGGKTADLKMRVYDRRGPLRLEFQWRPARQMSVHVAEMLRKRGVPSCWRALAENVVWPMPWYKELVAGETVELRRDLESETTFLRAVAEMRRQAGSNLWALQLLGISLDDLAVDPGENMRGDQGAKFLKFAREAEELRYADGSKLREAVKCRLRRARKCD